MVSTTFRCGNSQGVATDGHRPTALVARFGQPTRLGSEDFASGGSPRAVYRALARYAPGSRESRLKSLTKPSPFGKQVNQERERMKGCACECRPSEPRQRRRQSSRMSKTPRTPKINHSWMALLAMPPPPDTARAKRNADFFMLFPPKDSWLKALARPVRIVKKRPVTNPLPRASA